MPESPPAAPAARRVTPLALAGRIGSTVALWTVVGGALALPFNWLRVVVIAFFAILGTIEYALLTKADTRSVAHSLFMIVLAFGYWMVVLARSFGEQPVFPVWLDGVTLAVAVQGAFVLTFNSAPDSQNTTRRILNTVFGVAYTTISLGFLARLLFFGHGSNGALLLFFAIVVTKFGDVGAFAFGSLFGRTKLVPHISPAKTWEGLAGAFVSCVAVGLIVLLCAGAKLTPLTSWPHVVVLSILLCAVGVLGDLAESVLKRCYSIKDSGHLLPGIGGILDLTDSMIFSGPVAYYYLTAIS